MYSAATPRETSLRAVVALLHSWETTNPSTKTKNELITSNNRATFSWVTSLPSGWKARSVIHQAINANRLQKTVTIAKIAASGRLPSHVTRVRSFVCLTQSENPTNASRSSTAAPIGATSPFLLRPTRRGYTAGG